MMRALLLAVVVLAACAKSDDAPKAEPPPEPISAEEQERGTKACENYAVRACACAAKHPELVEECQLAQARPEALAATFGTLAAGKDEAGKLSRGDIEAAQATARKTIKACFEADAKLDPQLCPRP